MGVCRGQSLGTVIFFRDQRENHCVTKQSVGMSLLPWIARFLVRGHAYMLRGVSSQSRVFAAGYFAVFFCLPPRSETTRSLCVFCYCFTELFIFLWSSQRMGPHLRPRTKPLVCPIWSTRIHPGTFVYFWDFRWEIQKKKSCWTFDVCSRWRRTQNQKATDISKLRRKSFVPELTFSHIVFLVKRYRSAKRTNFYSCHSVNFKCWFGNDPEMLKVIWNSGE